MKKSIHSPGNEYLCARLVELRRQAGLTQRELARKVGCVQARIARIEVGERRVDILELHTLLGVLSADPKAEMLLIFSKLDELAT